jgi:hypothetical protein
MGSLDAYLAAPVFYVLGASAGTLEGMGVLVSLAWCALLLRLAWDAFGPRAALFAAFWLALPPDYLLYWSHEGRPVYLLSMALGTLALMLALRAPTHPPRRAVLDLALLGFVLGLAFWENFLTLVFLPSPPSSSLAAFACGSSPRRWPASPRLRSAAYRTGCTACRITRRFHRLAGDSGSPTSCCTSRDSPRRPGCCSPACRSRSVVRRPAS